MTITADHPALLDQLTVLAEETRARILQVLDGSELTVTELCEVLELPQSTVSRHIKLLGDQGWLERRRDGTRHFYGAATDALSDAERQLWRLVAADFSAARSELDLMAAPIAF